MNLLKLPTLLGLAFCLMLFNSCEEVINQINACNFSYGKVLFTQGLPSQTQEISPSFDRGTSTGTFSSSDNDLVLDPETGVIDINASVPKEYTITHDGETTCETSIVIQAMEQECELSYSEDLVVQGLVNFLSAKVNGEPAEEGRFYAIPAGLAISETNGAVDVASSESGIEYTVYYETEDKNTFCQTQLTIAGIDYEDQKVTFESGQEAIVGPDVVPDNFELSDIVFTSSNELLELNQENGDIDLKQTLRNIDLADNQELDKSIINLDNEGFTETFTVSYTYTFLDEEIVQSLEVQIFWFPNEEYQDNPDLQDLLEVFKGRGIPINGKIEKRPPYVLTVGDYE